MCDTARPVGRVSFVGAGPGAGSALSAMVAATGRELAEPAVLLANQDGGAAPGPDGVLAATAPAARTEALVARLRATGRPDDTPVVVGYQPSRSGELVLTTTLGELEAVKRHRLWLPAHFLVGRAAAAGGQRATASRSGSAPTVHQPWDASQRPYRRRRRNGQGSAEG